jgi:Zinc-finger double domain
VAAEEQRAKTPPGSVRCPHCDECFGGRERLTQHVRRECAARAFICETCGKHVRSVKALARHRVVHYPKKLECDFCHRTFHHKETIAKHVRTHMSVRPYQCAYCAKSFKHANILNDHVNVVHLGILKDAFPCVACPRSFCRRSHLERHMRTHTGERPYECDACGAKFASSYNMRAHRASVHKIMPHQCSICAVGVRTRQALADHCLQMHDIYI